MKTAVYGTPYHDDADVYIFYANTLATGQGFYDGMTSWTPFYPYVLAFFSYLLGVEPSDAGRILNIISIGLIVLIVGHFLRRYVRYIIVTIVATITIIVSFPLSSVYQYILSETLFIIVTLSALVVMASFLNDTARGSRFLFAIVLSALAPLIRYMGLTVVLTGILLILTCPILLARVRLKLAVVYSTTSLLPIVIWVTHNWTVNGTLTGARDYRSGQSLWDSLSQSGDLLYLWTFIDREPGLLAVGLWITAALILLQATILLVRYRRPDRSYLKPPEGEEEAKCYEALKARPALPFAAFTVVYFVALTIIVPQQVEHEIVLRYLVPIYIPLVVTAAIYLDRFLVALSTITLTGFSFEIQLKPSLGRWSTSYNNTLYLMDILKWILVGLILSVILAINLRNIALHIDVLTNYNINWYYIDGN